MYRKPLVFLFCLFNLARVASAAEPDSLRVRLATGKVPEVTLYFDLVGGNGQPVAIPQPSQFTLTVGALPAGNPQLQRFEHANEGVAYIFLVDISKSLKPEQFAQVRAALANWVEALTDKDRAAVLTFGKEVKFLQDFTGDKKSLQGVIESLAPTDTLTQLHQGLMRALEFGKRADPDLPRYRVIVILSDGQDDFPGGVTSQEVLDRLKEDRVPIYALGFAPLTAAVKDKDALKALGVFARTSGGEYLEASGDQLEADYAALRQHIRQVFVVRFLCPTCIADGQVQRVQLTHTAGTKTLTDGLSVRLLPHSVAVPASSAPAVTTTVTGNARWPYRMAGIIIACLFVGGLALFLTRKQPVEEDTAPPSLPVATPSFQGAGIQIRLTEIGNIRPVRAYVVRLVDQLVIGSRPSDCEVVIPDDPDISFRHCVLVRENDMVFIRDLNSRNGTLVNGVPIIGRHKLNEEDILLLGRTKLRFLRAHEGTV
jgi:Mg-chelatase subunit ChlD